MKRSFFITKLILATLYSICIFTNACAMGSNPPSRKDQDKLWRPCQDFETQNPIGKLCNRTCTSRFLPGTCTSKYPENWKTNIKDFSKKEDFEFFRNAAMVMISEDNL